MAVTDVLRPLSVRKTGGGTVVPSGTMAAVTSDNSDSTYIAMAEANGGNNWNLRVESHTPAANYQRHRIRGRIRIRTDAGTATEDIDVGRGTSDWISYGTINVADSFAEVATNWFQDTGYGLATVGALADLNIGGGWFDTSSGAAELRTSECYIDIDCRLSPQYGGQIQDNAGANKNEGTITDTNQPTFYIGSVDYDGLPALNWFVNVRTGSASGPNIFSASGSGTPPTEVPVTIGLDDGTYWAVWGVRSTIRGADSYENAQVHSFTIQNTVPPPSPPLVSATPESGGYRVDWVNPGGQPWDNNYVVAEVWRDDCYGSQRIAVVPDGLNGTYLDLAIPQRDPQPGIDCEVSSEDCEITYRVRYLGYVSTFVELPDTIPADMILGWPSTAGTIPSGWSRVTALDGVFPRGSTGTGAPSATGGAATHTHTIPSHAHTVAAHSHSVGGNTGTSNASTTSARFNGASQPQADQPHSHARPSSTGTAAAFTSGSATPGTGAANNTPAALDVIWIKSTGSQANYPVGCVGWATEAVSGWTTHAPSSARFLKGAAAAGNGGAQSGGGTHTHTTAAHSHTTGSTHDHSIGGTGLSNPSSSTEAGTGSSTPRWLPRHTHPLNVATGTIGATNSVSAGNTSAVLVEPVNRRLRVLQNSGGGTQTRIIGLFTGAVADLDPLLTLCNGSGGTPDMRGYFARDAGAESINSTGGSTSHNHTTPAHSHDIGNHSHTIDVLASTTGSFEAPSFGDLGSSPTTSHDHSGGSTASASPGVSSTGAQTTGTSDHTPPYKEVHFVRLDGTISGGPLPVPELKVSDFASVTVSSFTYSDGLDRLASRTVKLAVATDRSSAFPRLVADSVPLDGGLHTVATTEPGEDLTLTMAVEGMAAIDALEALLAEDWLYWSPLGGDAGWFRPQGWTVNRGAPGVWVVQITMVRDTWPSTDAPEDFL